MYFNDLKFDILITTSKKKTGHIQNLLYTRVENGKDPKIHG